MEIRRTANAGVLLKLDDVQILLDGVCREVKPYPVTPPAERQRLMTAWPDVLAFTHFHEDHYDADFAQAYQKETGRPVCGTGQMTEVSVEKTAVAGGVRLTAVPTRHMGHCGKTTQHQSYAVEGSQVIWFLGDASPTELKRFSGFPKPDVLMVPYPYVSTPPAVHLLEDCLPCRIVLLHLPVDKNDPEGIWQSAAAGIQQLKAHISLPELGETLKI